MLERKSASDLVCKVLVRERASAKGGTEGVGSAIEGESLLGSGRRQTSGEGGSKGRIRDQRVGLAGKRAERNQNGTDGLRTLSHQC